MSGHPEHSLAGRGQRSLETSWGVALWIIAMAALLFILDFASAILLPTAYAIIFSLVLAPIARALARLGIGDAGSAIVTVLLAAAALGGVIAFVAPAIADWVQDAPRLAQAIDRKLEPVKHQLEVVEDISKRISGQADAGARAVVASGEGMLGAIAASGANFISQSIYVIFLSLFLLSLRTDLRRRFIMSQTTMNGRIHMARAVRDVGKNVAAYLFVLTCINIGVAVVTTLSFYAAGLPDPLVWGAVFGLANYVPVIGPTGTILASALIGVATEPSLLDGLLGAAILLAINAVESQAVQPWLMARRIELNPVALFIGLAVVVWMWGVPAALISAPMLIVIYSFSRHTPALSPLAAILAPVTQPRHPLPEPPPLLATSFRRRASGTPHIAVRFQNEREAASPEPHVASQVGVQFLNWDRIEGGWTQFSGKAKEQWGKLTDDDLTEIDGRREQLAGKIQARYGVARDEAERQLDDWSKGL